MPDQSALSAEHLSLLAKGKNLLAFSAGIDSSALFFMLIEHHIHFDIALVNYATRVKSDHEEVHAISLAKRYSLRAHTVKAPQWKSDFEANARTYRYDFFESLIAVHGYDTLITAHQLNDQLEWFLMRLCRGAGVSELAGIDPVSTRLIKPDRNYTLIRPLLSCTKKELLEYLQSHHYPYFIDESNQDTSYERNRFRKLFGDPLLAQYSQGIARSFEYLRHDKELCQEKFRSLFAKEELMVVGLDGDAYKSKAADLCLKELGYLLSARQREEIELHDEVVIGGRWAVVYQDNRLYIAPYITSAMPKFFKELCRVYKLPSKIRPYCYLARIDPGQIMER